jgi:hypothetical protein
MDAAAMAQIIESKPAELIEGLNAELKGNLGTSHYHRLSEDELVRRHSHIFDGLACWLRNSDESALQKSGESLGERRFREGTPLGQVVLVLILVERQLVDYFNASPKDIPQDVRRAVTGFFQKYAYYTAKGYEASLAVSNRLARSGKTAEIAVPEERPVKPAGTVSGEGDMEISRGGQVGEFGG